MRRKSQATTRTSTRRLILPLKKLSDNDLVFSFCLAALLITLCLMALPPVNADPENYLTSGDSNTPTYSKIGYSPWGSITPTTYARPLYTTMQSPAPVVGDLNDDGINEIVFIADGYLYALHYSAGTFTLVGSIAHGNPAISTNSYLITPALYDYDSDGKLEVITTNITHALLFKYNGTAFSLNQSAATGMNGTSAPTYTNKYVDIKCESGTHFSSGNSTCFFFGDNRTGGTTKNVANAYDLGGNIVNSVEDTAVVSNADTSYHSTFVNDGDGDGLYEAYHAYNDFPNGDLAIFKVDLDSSSFPTATKILTDNQAANRKHTDIILSNLDGYAGDGLDITFGFSSDGVNYDAKTIKANDAGTSVKSSYCSTLTDCAEGDDISNNLWVNANVGPSANIVSAYSDGDNDVCYYVRNYDQSELFTGQDAYEDAVVCMSQTELDIYKITLIPNTAYNLSSTSVFHGIEVGGSYGLVSDKFMLDENALASSNPFSGNDAFIIPVDYQFIGILEFIGLNTTVLRYIATGLSNDNVNITSFGSDTGSPACQYSIIGFSAVVVDGTNDNGNCYLQILYFNGTSVGTYYNQSISTPSTDYFYYNADINGDFYARVFCKDQYHVDYVNRTRTFRVTNSTPCFNSGEGGSNTTYNVTVTTTDTSLDDAMDDLFGASTKMKAIAGIGIIIGIMVGVGTYSAGNPIAVIVAGLLGTILVTYMGLISAYILILIIAGLVLLIIISRFVAPNIGGGQH